MKPNPENWMPASPEQLKVRNVLYQMEAGTKSLAECVEELSPLTHYLTSTAAASSSLLPVPRQIQVQCEMCDGTGQMHVTHDMAIDAGNLNLSGQLISCGTCGGDGFKIEQAEPNENENLASLPVGESTREK